jgi:hypothetical protein
VKPDARAIAEQLVDRFWSQFGPGKAEAIPMIERALSAAADAARERAEEAEASLATYVREHDRAWAAVREGLEPDAYREGKFDLHHAIQHRIDAARQEVINLVRDDGYAMTFQSLGQYRTALLKSLRARDTGRQR